MKPAKRCILGKKLMLFMVVTCAYLTQGLPALAQNSHSDALKTQAEFPGGKSAVDWKQGFIEITAWGSANTRETANIAQAKTIALKTARHLAFEKAAERVYGLNLNAEALYGNEALINSHLRTSTSGVIRNAAVMRENVMIGSDGSPWAEVTIRLLLNGEYGLSGPAAQWAISPQGGSNTFAPKEGNTDSHEISQEKRYTGLIVDASGLGARPAMVVKVLAEDDLRTVYGPHAVDRNAAMKTGFAAYSSSVAEAFKVKRAGENPLVIKARSVAGSNKADLVITSDDAARLYGADLQGGFLKQCKVVVVIN